MSAPAVLVALFLGQLSFASPPGSSAVNGYPTLDANRVYTAGQQVKIEGHSSLLGGADEQPAAVWQPDEVVDSTPVLARHGPFETGRNIDFLHTRVSTIRASLGGNESYSPAVGRRLLQSCSWRQINPFIYLVGTSFYLITEDQCWARSTALMVEVVGVETRDASTLYSVLNATVTIPLLYMIRLDGFGFSRFGTHGLLGTDAAANLLMFAVVAVVFVVCDLRLRRVPASKALTRSTSI